MKLVRPINDKNPNITNAFGSGHAGTDYGYPDGTPIYASESGKVLFAVNDCNSSWSNKGVLTTKDYGNFVKIQHGENYQTLYCHLKKDSLLVKVGDTVEKGQKIAEINSTGNSTGNHLHWEVRFGEICTDPYPLLDTSFSNYFITQNQTMDYKVMYEEKAKIETELRSVIHQKDDDLVTINKQKDSSALQTIECQRQATIYKAEYDKATEPEGYIAQLKLLTKDKIPDLNKEITNLNSALTKKTNQYNNLKKSGIKFIQAAVIAICEKMEIPL